MIFIIIFSVKYKTLNKMDSSKGSKLSKNELKHRLTKMNIPYDSKIIPKQYYINLYNEAIEKEENCLKIKNELHSDTYSLIPRRSLNHDVIKEEIEPVESYKSIIVNDSLSNSSNFDDFHSYNSTKIKKSSSKAVFFGIGIGVIASAGGYILYNNVDKIPFHINKARHFIFPLAAWLKMSISSLQKFFLPILKICLSQIQPIVESISKNELISLILVMIVFFVMVYAVTKLFSFLDKFR